MKTTELRIGNWVRFIDNKEQFQIGCISHNEIEMGFVLLSEVEPIPLTEERFKNLNPKFQYLRDFSAIYDLQGITVELSGYGLPNPKFFISGIEIKSMHKLQNIYFALTGEELTKVSEGENKNFV